MKRWIVIIAGLFFLGQSSSLLAKHNMICVYGRRIAAYTLSDKGDIKYDYEITVDGNPETLCFAPNGRWGMSGSHTTSSPSTRKTIILGVDDSRKIEHLGSVHCEVEDLVAISPDSRYGIYGWYYCSLEFLPDGTYREIHCPDMYLGERCASFSSLNGNIITSFPTDVTGHTYLFSKYNKYEAVELSFKEDGKTTETGERLEISPSTGTQDIEISPDGRTCVLLSGPSYQITVLRLHEKRGISLVQQFDTTSLNCSQVVFSPDSNYAVVSFIESSYTRPALRCYSIDDASRLTEVSVEYLEDYPGEDLAITPDGKFVVTRFLSSGVTTFNVIRLHDDGTLEYLPEKDYSESGYVSAIEFLPEPQPTGWVMH